MKLDKSAFDPKAVKLLAAHETASALFAVCLDAARHILFGAGMDGAIHAVDLSTAKPAALKRWTAHDNYVSALVLHQRQLVSAGFDRRLVWTDLDTGKRVRSIVAHDGWVRKLVPTSDGACFVTTGDDMLLTVWEAATGKPIASLAGHARRTPEGYLSALYAAAVSCDGKYAASGDRAGFIRVWDLAAGKSVAEFRAAELYTFDARKRARAIGGVRGLAFSSDGSRLAVSGIGSVTNVDGFVGPCRVELWDWKTARRVAVGENKHQAILNHVAFGPASSWLTAAGGGDGGGALVFWDSADPAAHVAKPKGHLHAFVLDAEGKRLYAVGHGGFQIWQLRG
ncbi:MAG: WD40 repeat domain-containing protein [Gemmataceae bacterium]